MAKKAITIKFQIIRSAVLFLFIPILLLGGGALVSTYNGTMTSTKEESEEIVLLGAERIEWELEAFKNIVKMQGTQASFADSKLTDADRKIILSSIATAYGFERGNYISKDGKGIDGNTYTDRAYFQNALKGEVTVSEPVISKVTGELTVIIAAPVWKNGVVDSEVVGCVYFVPHETF